MKKLLSLVLFIALSFTGFGQIASRLLTSQATPQLISAPNFMWVDTAATAQTRIWVASLDSLKIRAFQMRWLKDSVLNFTSGQYKPLNWFPSWSEVSSKPTFSIVATTGQYNDLLSKPSLFSGSYLDLTNVPSIFPSDISNVSGLSSALNNKITIGANIPYATITGSPTLATVATTGNYSDLNGLPSLFSGSYNDLTNKPTIPTNNNQLTNGSNFITASGAPVQSVNGQTGNVVLSIPSAQIQSDWNQNNTSALDYIKNKPTIPTDNNQLTNGAGYITGITGTQVNTALGYTPYSATNPNGYINGINSSQVTTALGFTPYNSSNPNNYISRSGISAGTGISYDNTTGIITNSAPDQTVNITAGTGIGVSGTYPNFTVSSTIASPTINSGVSRTVNSNYTISTTRMSTVYYTINISVTNPLLIGTSTGTAFLEYSTNGGSSWTTASQISNSSGVGLTVTVALTTGGNMILTGTIPANALTRIRTTTSGTASVTYTSGQEVLN